MVTISGTVTDTNDEPVVGVQVYVYDEDDEDIADEGTTDSNGDFSFDVGDNTYHVIFSYEDGDGDEYNTKSYPKVV